MGTGTSTLDSREFGRDSLKYCYPDKSNNNIPETDLRNTVYLYTTYDCNTATRKTDNEETKCSDGERLRVIYEGRIKDYFQSLDECLQSNRFRLFMIYYKRIIALLTDEYTLDQSGVIKLKKDIKKVNEYILNTLGEINVNMAKGRTGEIRVLVDIVNVINQKLNIQSSELSTTNPYYFSNENDTRLNNVKFFNSEEESILTDTFFNRVIDYYSLMYILNSYPKIEQTLNNYEIPDLTEDFSVAIIRMDGNKYRYKRSSYKSDEDYDFGNFLTDPIKAQATNTIKELLDLTNENSVNIQQTIDRINEITMFIGYFRNSGPNLLIGKTIITILDNYINRINLISEKVFTTWDIFNRQTNDNNITFFTELVRLLFDNSYLNSLMYKVIDMIDNKIDDHINQLDINQRGGRGFKANNLTVLNTIKDKYNTIKDIYENLLKLRLFNQNYTFKCQKFRNKVHLVLAYNNQSHENYLLNPNDNSAGTPTIYDEDIGPVCIKDKNPYNIEARNICFDYETMERCNNHLLQPVPGPPGSSFVKELIDNRHEPLINTANRQVVYSMGGKLFNDKSTLHNTDFSNINQDNINILDTEPVIRERVTTTTTTTTTTQYVHMDIDSQPPTTTRQPDPQVPDDIIPNGIYYLSIVEDTVEKYLTLYKNVENDNYFIQKTDFTDNNKNRSIIMVRNVVINEFSTNPMPEKFITINYTDTEEEEYYFQINTNSHNNKIIIIEQRDTNNYPLTDSNYFLPVEHEPPTVSSNPIYSVNLKSVLPTESNTDSYCRNISDTTGNLNLTQIESDLSINNIIGNLLNIRNDNNLPLIGCSFDEPNIYFKFEFKESI